MHILMGRDTCAEQNITVLMELIPPTPTPNPCRAYQLAWKCLQVPWMIKYEKHSKSFQIKSGLWISDISLDNLFTDKQTEGRGESSIPPI
jgi:hypothetical protein